MRQEGARTAPLAGMWGETRQAMRKTIPLIRSAGLVPLLRWLIARKRPVEQLLHDANIGYVWLEDPFAPLPIHAMEQLLLALVALEPPDFGCLAVGPEGVRDIAALGGIAAGARNAREALSQISAAMPYHCSHELISFTPGPQHCVVTDYWNLNLDPHVQHVIQQFVAMMFQDVLSGTGLPGPHFARIEMTPHPELGVEYLRPWFNCEMVATPGRVLSATFRTDLADHPFVRSPKELPGRAFPRQKLNDGTMAGSARLVIRQMLRDRTPTIAELSRVGGISVRSLQRRLDEEKTSFSELLDDERRRAAIAALTARETMVGEAAAHAGYAKQSSLTRAMRRWTGYSPQGLRNAIADEGGRQIAEK